MPFGSRFLNDFLINMSFFFENYFTLPLPPPPTTPPFFHSKVNVFCDEFQSTIKTHNDNKLTRENVIKFQ